MENTHIVIFDGVCNLCNSAINFIIQRDAQKTFVFTPMQSKLAKELLQQYKIDNVGVDTFLLVKDGKTFIWTNAALEITKDLSGFWYIEPLLETGGRSDRCITPTDKLKSRFIGIEIN